LKGTLLAVIISFIAMGVAYRYARIRSLHVTVMLLVVTFDIVFPVYLYLVNDWYKQMIQEEQIFTFSPWMHFMLIIVLYALYVIQIQAGRRLLADHKEARQPHKQQGQGIMLARLLVFATGALLLVR